MTGLSRRLAACIAALALGFAQLAVSAYACSGMPMERSATSAASDCDEGANPNLCERHCDYGSASVQPPSHAAFAVAIPVMAWRIEIADTPQLAPARTSGPSLARRIERPPLERFGVLRI